jgi:hypothetical protein
LCYGNFSWLVVSTLNKSYDGWLVCLRGCVDGFVCLIGCLLPIGFWQLVLAPVLSAVHLYSVTQEMRAAPINTLNAQRTAMLVADFMKVPSFLGGGWLCDCLLNFISARCPCELEWEKRGRRGLAICCHALLVFCAWFCRLG